MERTLWSLSQAEIAELSFAPVRLRFARHGDGIGAREHEARHTISELLADAPFGRRPVLGVLHGVVQEPGDGAVLVAPVLEDERAHRHEVGKVRDPRGLAGRLPVDLESELHALEEALAEL